MASQVDIHIPDQDSHGTREDGKKTEQQHEPSGGLASGPENAESQHTEGESHTILNEAKDTPLLTPQQIEDAISMNEYRIKKIQWQRGNSADPGAKTPPETQPVAIITQNANGPCALLALCNVLLLSGDIYLNPDREVVTFEHLVEMIGEYLLTLASRQGQTYVSEKKLEAILKVLPTLQKGLDVNVFFTSPTSFGSSPDSLPAFYLFAMFGVMLCHGWLPDPQAGETYTIVAEKLGSYNDVVDRVVDGKNENASDSIVHEALVCEAFLNETSGQLTYHGLQQLSETIPIGSLAVFFRNNHFSTIYRHSNGQLFSLVTDVGYFDQASVVWETIDNIEGDSQYVDGSFREFKASQSLEHNPGPMAGTSSEEADYALAVQLQRQEELAQSRHNLVPVQQRIKPASAIPSHVTPSSATSSSSVSSFQKKKDNCIVQ